MKLRVGLCLSLALYFSCAPASDAVEKQLKYVTWGIGATATVSVATIIALVVSHKMHAKKVRKLRAEHEALSADLTALSARVDEIPFNDFLRQADKKIAEVRRLLDEDVERHRRTIFRDIEALRAELSRLTYELERRDLHLTTVVNLINSIRDNNETAFIEKLTQTKVTLELALQELNNDRSSLSQYMNEILTDAGDIDARLQEQKNVMAHIESDTKDAQSGLAVYQEHVADAERFIATVLDEAVVARKNIVRAQGDFATLNNDLRFFLQKMEEVCTAVCDEKESAEKQLKQAQALLSDIKVRVSQMVTTAAQEEVRMQEFRSSIIAKRDCINRTIHELENNNYGYTASPSPAQTSVLHKARAELADIFQIIQSTDATAYRKGYRAFCMKNHPDKGGNTAVFQAVDGLYQLLGLHNLFDAQNASAQITQEIEFKLEEIQKIKSLVIQ